MTTPTVTVIPRRTANLYHNKNFDNFSLVFKTIFARCSSSSGSSNNWKRRQSKDPFVKQAAKDNYRCRSAYKLIQMDDRYGFLQPGNIVIDCGASPGSWCQVAVQRVNSNGADVGRPIGKVIGIDLLNIEPIQGAQVLPFSDFTETSTQTKIKQFLDNRKANVILSDMAPNATGIKSLNHEYIIGLCFSVLHFSLYHLELNGTFLCKLWMGAEQDRLKSALDRVFDKVGFVKPESSRSDSAEIFCLARDFKGIPNKS